jgi:hypothetical protein
LTREKLDLIHANGQTNQGTKAMNYETSRKITLPLPRLEVGLSFLRDENICEVQAIYSLPSGTEFDQVEIRDISRNLIYFVPNWIVYQWLEQQRSA